MTKRIVTALAAVITAVVAGAANPAPREALAAADPMVRDPAAFDPRRPVEAELQTRVPDGFEIAAVGDLIISRPMTQLAGSVPGFKAVLDLFKRPQVVFGNMETAIFEPRTFKGAPFSWDGDWTNSALPAVATDLKRMGFSIASRANNHSLDWGLEGLHETSRWLDEAGIAHAGVGDTRGLARAPRYLETSSGRVALISLASTFRPTTEALPEQGATPARPGLSALHLTETIQVPAEAMKSLADADCVLHRAHCGPAPDRLVAFGKTFVRGKNFSYEYAMDPEDLADIYKSIRAARQNADFVVVAIHSHECSTGCDDNDVPRGAGNFLKELAHGAVDSGADIFVTTGNHNLGAVEIYRSPVRGNRPIFYGLGNFFWSDIQELLPHDLFQANREMLAQSWKEPGKATEYDLTAPLNAVSFAHAFTFQSVIARCRFNGNQLAQIELHPVEMGYGSKLTTSGIPRLVTDTALSAAILGQIDEQTARLGLPRLNMTRGKNSAIIRP